MTSKLKFSGALLKARNQKKLTQEQTAELLDISNRWYQKIESGRSEPNLALTCKIVKEFGLKLEEFVDEDNEGAV